MAWYPVYRIPEGNFRAAFLTYHSLGHLVHRRSAFDSACMDICIVSPVVGLQSYNAQVDIFTFYCIIFTYVTRDGTYSANTF